MVGGINYSSPKFRIGGLATGMDTDQMVKDLMRAERIPLDKVMQNKIQAEWKRDDYRDITNLLRSLKDEYFNVIKTDSYMLSDANYKNYIASSSNSEYVTATGTSQSPLGNNSIKVKRLATADTAVSGGQVSAALEGTPIEFDLEDKTIKITLDGITKEISLENYTDLEDMKLGIQGLVDTAFGTGKILVGGEGEKLAFLTQGGASKITLEKGTGEDGLETMGFSSGASNRININKTLEQLSGDFRSELEFDGEDNLQFSINSKAFTFSKTTSLSAMMSTINGDSKAGVTIKYDEISDKFTMVAKQTGAGDNIHITQTGGNFFTQEGVEGVAGIDIANPIIVGNGGRQGQDALITINGQDIVRATNNFNVNGISYTIHKAHEESSDGATISINQDIDGAFDKIKSFIDKYNEVIDKINGKISEERDRNYRPLTNEQKDDMSEDEIKKWEEKAKAGLLRNDRLLEKIVNSMRVAMSDGIQGVSSDLFGIGITTGSYQEKGKLKIDENSLKNALRNDIDSVMGIFAKKSSVTNNIDLTAEEKNKRYNEEGVAYRLFDIIEDNIRTFRDKNDKKGVLLEKAGIQGDTTEFKSLMYDEIKNFNKRIEEFNRKLFEKENQYYRKFTAMEKAIAQMNNQSNWLASQFN